MTVSRILPFVILLASGASALAEPPAETDPLPLTVAHIGELAEEAQTNNTAIRAALARVEAAQAEGETVPTWDDPMVRLGGMGANSMMRREDGDLLYGVEQKLPLWGKPQAARRLAQAGASISEASATLRAQQLKRDVAIAVLRVALADHTVRLGREDLRWLETLLETVEQRYATGGSSQTDLLRLQNERSRRANQLETDIRLRNQARADLNRLLNRSLESPWPEWLLPPVANPVEFNERLVGFALKFSPDLKMRRAEIREAEAAVEVSRRARYPDLTAGAEVRQYSGNGDLRQSMVMLGINIPWGNRRRYAAAIQRDEAKLRATRLDTADYELELRNEVRQLTVKIDAARREALLYRDQIIPRSEAALASIRAAWETGRGTLRDVLDARRMLIEAQLMQARATTEQYELLADLILCCGLGDLEALDMIGALAESENKTSEGTKP